MYKNIILFLFIAISFSVVAIEDGFYETKSLRYKKDTINGIEVFFPKKQQEIFDAMFQSEMKETYFFIAKDYFCLEQEELSTKYFEKYDVISQNYFAKAIFYKKIGNIKKEIENLLLFLNNCNELEKNNYIEYVKKECQENNVNFPKYIEVSKLKLLLEIENELDFSQYYKQNQWTDEENKKILSYIESRNTDNRLELNKIMTALKENQSKEEYYFDKINSIFDKNAYYAYFSALKEKNEIYAPTNEFEELLFLKYQGKNFEVNENYDKKMNEAIIQKNFEKIYGLLMLNINDSNETKNYYNLSLVGEKYLAKFIKKIQLGMDIGEEGKREEILNNLIISYCNTYPIGAHIEEITLIRIGLTKDNLEKIKIIDEYLAKKMSKPIFLEKLKALNAMGNYIEIEKNVKVYLESNLMNKEILSEILISFEKQGKIHEGRNFLEKYGDAVSSFEYSQKNNLTTSSELKRAAIDNYIKNGNVEKIEKFKTEMVYSQYKEVISKGNSEFNKIASEKYPIEKNWIDNNNIRFFFFTENFQNYDSKMLEMLNLKKDKNDVEKYYMAKAYSYKGDYARAIDIMREIISKYRTEEIIVKFYLDILEKGGTKMDFDNALKKYGRTLNWESFITANGGNSR